MPNGDCPTGAENRADIRNLARTCDELRRAIEGLADRVEIVREGQTDMRLARAWDWRQVAIIVLMVMGGSAGGNVIVGILQAAVGQ